MSRLRFRFGWACVDDSVFALVTAGVTDRMVVIWPVTSPADFAATAGRYGPSGFSTAGGGKSCGGGSVTETVRGTDPVGERGPEGAGRVRVPGLSVISSTRRMNVHRSALRKS